VKEYMPIITKRSKWFPNDSWRHRNRSGRKSVQEPLAHRTNYRGRHSQRWTSSICNNEDSTQYYSCTGRCF